MKRFPPIRPLSTAAADQTQRQNPTVLQRAESSNVWRWDTAQLSVCGHRALFYSALWERTLSFHRRPSRTLRGGFFSVKQRAESDLGDRHQPSSCSWVIWRGHRARRRVTAALSGLFFYFLYMLHLMLHISRLKQNWSNRREETNMYLCFASVPMCNKQSIHHKDHRTLIYSTVEYFSYILLDRGNSRVTVNPGKTASLMQETNKGA